MRVFQLQHVYDYEWETVSSAAWQKYPHPNAPQVVNVDVTDRVFDADTGKLYTNRLMTTTGTVPGFVESWVGSKYAHFQEQSEVDPKQRKMVLRTKNVSFGEYLEVEEVCTYEPDPENESRTLFTQEVRISSASMLGLKNSIESFCADRFIVNAENGRNVMASVCSRVAMQTLNEDDLAYVGSSSSSSSSSTTGSSVDVGATGLGLATSSNGSSDVVAASFLEESM